METGKMQWLIDRINDGKAEYQIHKAGGGKRTHGVIQCPTGYGKSGMIFEDIIWHMLDTKKKGQRLVVNLSTPIIKLCAQQGVDLFSVINGVAKKLGINTRKIRVYNNNSGSGNQLYVENEQISMISGVTCRSFSEFTDDFVGGGLLEPQFQIAIVISCHKSVGKFIGKLGKQALLNTRVVTYLDEAHTVTMSNEECDDDELVKIDLQKLCAICNYLYLVSATNKQELVRIVNSFDTGRDDDDDFIVEITPHQAIDENIICAPTISYQCTDDGIVTPDICKWFMNLVRNNNTEIVHKILVTCNSQEQLKQLRVKLSEMYPVFSTCSNEGAVMQYGKDKKEYGDGVKVFIDDIDKCAAHCFVLHVRQLISGIDVKSISDVIMSKADIDNLNSYDTMVQIIGRALRLGGERGIGFDDRKKKTAYTLVVTTGDKKDDLVNSKLSQFFIRYYGTGNIRFTKSFDKNVKPDSIMHDLMLFEERDLFSAKNGNLLSFVYKEVLIDIEDYVRELTKDRMCFDFWGNPLPYGTKEHEDYVESIIAKFEFGTDSLYLTRFNKNKDLRDAVISLLKKYGF